MGYIDAGEHDIFVSYAQRDNKPLEGVEKGWVTTLVSNLTNRLERKLGSGASLWMDREIDGNASLTPAIMDALRQIEVMVVIVSPGYLKSEWCKLERETFFNLVRERSHSKSRVFVVHMDEVDRNKLPAEFSDLLGYKFWVQEAGKPSRTLADPKPRDSEEAYWNLITDLSGDLAQELEKIKESVQGPSAIAAPQMATPIAVPQTVTPISATQGPAVFLAKTTDDLEEEHDEVKRYLKQAGLRVLPEIKYSEESPDAFKQMMDKDLAQCKLFVQLLSKVRGQMPEGYSQRMPVLLHDCAKQSETEILQWRSPDALESVKDDDHRLLLEGTTVQATGLEEFKRTIVEEATRPAPSPPPKPMGVSVFVNADSPDRDLAKAVRDLLVKKYGVGCILPLEKGEPNDIREDMETQLEFCDALMVIYGKTTPVWVRRQLALSRGIIGQRKQPLRILTVFDGPPSEKGDLELDLPDLHNLKCRTGLDEASLREFVGHLGGNPE